ncbi:NLR family CARD domain-containing protein 3-like [Montipora foliosa]|uniref:NLR family CARD domain-containing protein 3-like n=1 Tax=Montipora foliosa TaxID=591990 RepID=UPI0035F1D8A4
MVRFSAFDDHVDASAVLLLLGRVPVFLATVQAAANSVRNERNDWAHCVFSNWNEAKFQHSFAEMEDLVKAMALPSSEEGKIVGELKDWQNKGTQLCMNSPVDQALLQLVHQNVYSLESKIKNWPEELKEEKDKVQQQLQIFRSEITQRLAKLETGQQRLKTGQKRLGNELQRLESDHKRWKTEQQRLQSDVEQRVIKCEGEISYMKEERSQQESHAVVANPGRITQLIRRDYKKAMLCPFPWCEDELQYKLENIFTRLQIVSKTKERSRLTDVVVNMTDVFKPHADCKNPRVVLVEGNPAMGKTTYCQKLAYDWSLSRIPADSWFPKVEMLLLLKCRDMNVGILNIQEAIDDQLLPKDVDGSDKENVFDFIRANQSRILLVLDGLDELKHKDLFQGLLPLIQGKVLSNIYLLLTARLEMGAKVRRYCDSLLQIVGYSKDDAISYIEQYFRNHSDPSLAQKLKDKLADDYQLIELTTSPMNTALLCLVCEETNGIFPTKQTELYDCLVSCAIRRYCAKRGDDLGDDNPSERYRDQLNQLGKMAFEALLKNRVYFCREEMKSADFLQLCFVTHEPSRSKMKPTQCYAFTHKTFQEYFAALYLTNQVLTDSKEGEALLLKVSPLDNWRVWEFLFPLVAKKDCERAVFLVSCFGGAVSRHAISGADDITETTQFEKSPVELVNFSFGCHTLPNARDRLYTYIVNDALDVIANCEDFEEVLSDCQRKMLVKLAECIPLHSFNNRSMKNSRTLLAFSEYLSGSCTLTELIIPSCYEGCPKRGLKALAQILHTNCVLTRLDLSLEPRLGDEIAVAFSEALEINTTVTHLNLSGSPECEQITPSGASALARALTKNRTLKCLVLGSNSIRDSGALAFADALQTNSTLTQLDLSRNDIGDLGTEAIFKALQSNHVMTHLVLSGNTISDSGAEALAGVLQSSATQLSYVNLAGCKITSLGAKALAGAPQINRRIWIGRSLLQLGNDEFDIVSI